MTGNPPDRYTSTVIRGASTPTQARLYTCDKPTMISLSQPALFAVFMLWVEPFVYIGRILQCP